MPAKITALRILGQLLLRLQANDFGPVLKPESFPGNSFLTLAVPAADAPVEDMCPL